MNVRRTPWGLTLAFALLTLAPARAPAQTLQILSQVGDASATAAVSGPSGSDVGIDGAGVPSAGPVDIFAGAGASVDAEMFASATADLEATLAPRDLAVSAALDANGSVTDPFEQTAGGSASVFLTVAFTVDAPVYFTLTGATTGVWTSLTSVDTGFTLEDSTGILTDMIGIGGQVDYQGVLRPGERYTLHGYGMANAVTDPNEPTSFGSAQGGFTINLSLGAAATPEPATALLLLPAVALAGLHHARRRGRSAADPD